MTRRDPPSSHTRQHQYDGHIPTRRRTFPPDPPPLRRRLGLRKDFYIFHKSGSSTQLPSVLADLKLTLDRTANISSTLWSDIQRSARRTTESFPASDQDAGDVAWLYLYNTHQKQPDVSFRVPFAYRWERRADSASRSDRLSLVATRWLEVEPTRTGMWRGVVVDHCRHRDKSIPAFGYALSDFSSVGSTDRVLKSLEDSVQDRCIRAVLPVVLTTDSYAEVHFE